VIIAEHTHLYKPTQHFSKKLDQIKLHDLKGYDRIHKVIERLLAQPGKADGKMHSIHQGRYKKYVGRREYRIIYHWCRLCRKENRRLLKHCDDCQVIPDNSVIFFDLYHKKDKKRFKRST